MPRIACPICRLELHQAPRAWTCDRGHGFDVAREGYVNLLPSHHRNSRQPGDSAGSLMARRRFLEAGHYAPLRAAVIAALAPEHYDTLLDVGCGEGTYTHAFQPIAREVIGVDIAKPAVQMAAKRFTGVTWLVASGAGLPVPEASLDAVTCLFTHLHLAELRRTVRRGGEVLVVTPAPEHLWSVREGLFEQVRPHEPEKVRVEFEDGFQVIGQQEVQFDLDLSGEALQQLLAMTPYVWKARPERRQALEMHARFATRAAFSIQRFRRDRETRDGEVGERARATVSDLPAPAVRPAPT